LWSTCPAWCRTPELADWISGETELDTFIDTENAEPETLIVGFAHGGITIEFPCTLAQFWETVDEVHDQIVDELEEGDRTGQADASDPDACGISGIGRLPRASGRSLARQRPTGTVLVEAWEARASLPRLYDFDAAAPRDGLWRS